jgi:glycosyltransferase involved in cell wall biosynthesis
MMVVDLWTEGSLGLGFMGRMLDDALLRLGCHVRRFTVGSGAIDRPPGPVPDAVIVAANADRMPLMDEHLRHLPRHVRRSAVWFWETSRFPAAHRRAAEFVDEVWLASEFVDEAVRRVIDRPTRVFPVAFAPDPIAEEPWRPPVPSADPYFLFAFDCASFAQRKNPWAVIEAWDRCRADADVPLVIKVSGHQAFPDTWRRLRALAAQTGFTLVGGHLDAAQMTGLYQGSLAYVSLHRAEGFGLTMAEAMRLGRPVIATGYSGNLQFMSAENSLLVPFRLVGIGRDAGPYAHQGNWAEPDIDAAAALMSSVTLDPALRDRLGAAGEASARQAFDPARLDGFLADRLGMPSGRAAARH